MEKAVKGKNCT